MNFAIEDENDNIIDIYSKSNHNYETHVTTYPLFHDMTSSEFHNKIGTFSMGTRGLCLFNLLFNYYREKILEFSNNEIDLTVFNQFIEPSNSELNIKIQKFVASMMVDMLNKQETKKENKLNKKELLKEMEYERKNPKKRLYYDPSYVLKQFKKVMKVIKDNNKEFPSGYYYKCNKEDINSFYYKGHPAYIDYSNRIKPKLILFRKLWRKRELNRYEENNKIFRYSRRVQEIDITGEETINGEYFKDGKFHPISFKQYIHYLNGKGDTIYPYWFNEVIKPLEAAINHKLLVSYQRA